MKTISYFFFFFFLHIFILSCKKDKNFQEDISLPTLTTEAITSITPDFAVSGGNINSDGGAAVTARGVCWGTSSAPDILNSHTTDGTGIGLFTSNLSGLVSGNTYYVRAYATNSAGTAYGNEISFTTPANIYVGGSKPLGSNPAATVWKNGIPTSYTNGNTFAGIEAIFVSNGDVYAVGYETEATMVAKIWKNGVPSTLSNTSNSASAKSIFIKGTDVYVSGYERVSNVTQAKLWKNGIATTLSNPANESFAKSVFVSGTDVYAAGYESVGVMEEAKIWKNGVGTSLTSGVASFANSVFVSGTDVYVAGVINDQAVVWKNGVAVNLTPSGTGYASKVLVSGNDVYVVGYEVTQTYKMATIWKNNIPTRLYSANNDCFANDIFIFGSDVYVAGFNFFSSNSYAMLWKNGIDTEFINTSVASGASSLFVTN